MKTYKWLMGFLAVGMLLMPASMSFAAPPGTAPIAEHRTQPEAQAQTPARTYAAREAASAAKVEKFRGGGSGVYIGGTTLVIVLLVVLIIVLI